MLPKAASFAFLSFTSFMVLKNSVSTYAYAPLTGELVSVSHSDDTPGWKFTYNHIGQMTYVRDASGIRECSYDVYGNMIQDTSFGTVESSLQEEYDPFGRSAGCRLMLGTRTVQHSYLDYDSKGDIIGMNLEGLAPRNRHRLQEGSKW